MKLWQSWTEALEWCWDLFRITFWNYKDLKSTVTTLSAPAIPKVAHGLPRWDNLVLLWEQNGFPMRSGEPHVVRSTIPDWWQGLCCLQSQRVGETEKSGCEVLGNWSRSGGKGGLGSTALGMTLNFCAQHNPKSWQMALEMNLLWHPTHVPGQVTEYRWGVTVSAPACTQGAAGSIWESNPASCQVQLSLHQIPVSWLYESWLYCWFHLSKDIKIPNSLNWSGCV